MRLFSSSISGALTLALSTLLLAHPSQSQLLGELAAEGGSTMDQPESSEDPRCAGIRPISGFDCDISSQDQLQCSTDYAWMGCSEPLVCQPTQTCTCNQLGDGKWGCLLFGVSQNCDPDPTPSQRGDSCTPGDVYRPVDDTDVTPPNIFSDFTCRPFFGGCNGAHTVESDCDGTPSCCPDNIVVDWRSDQSTCSHNLAEELIVQTGQAASPNNVNLGPNTFPISFYGLNYNTRKGPDWAADRERCKSRAEVVRDLQILSRVTTRIRVLSMVDCDQGALVWSVLNDELSSVPMEVFLGLWVGPEEQEFINDFNRLTELMPEITNKPNWESRLSGISVGSEAIYRDDVTVSEAISNLESTRNLLETYGVNVPVAIVDIAPVYSGSQELRLASDTIMTNTFPFWEGLPIEIATDELEVDLGWLVNLPESQGKPFILSETGWPSAGYLDDVGVASPENQLRYLEESYCYLHKEKGWAYYWFTAIDNDWRQVQDPNNSIEGNWGFLTADLLLKDHFKGFSFTCPQDGSTYTFDAIDWNVPALQADDQDIDPANASCGLWSGCEALDGDCCPTPTGDYLGCCRSENFLGVPDLVVVPGLDSSTIRQSDSPSCNFCPEEFAESPTITFSNGNSVSCGGLTDLINSGLGAGFCEDEREFIEAACCSSPGSTPTSSAPTDGPPGEVEDPTPSPTLRQTRSPTKQPTEFPTVSLTTASGCDFCVGEEFLTEPTIIFSDGNDSVSCAGLLDLIRSGLSSIGSFCDTYRNDIESACCRPIPQGTTLAPTRKPTPSPTRWPTFSDPTPFPTAFPTRTPPSVPPTRIPTGTPTTATPTGTPTLRPTGSPTPEVVLSLTSVPLTSAPSDPPTSKAPTGSPTESPEDTSSVFPPPTDSPPTDSNGGFDGASFWENLQDEEDTEVETIADGTNIDSSAHNLDTKGAWTIALLVGGMLWSICGY